MPATSVNTNVPTDHSSGSDLSIAVAHWHVNSWGGAAYLVTKLAEAVGTDRIYTLGQPDPEDPNPYGDVDWVDVTSGPGAFLKRRMGRSAEYALWEDVDWREYGDFDVIVTSGSTTRAVLTPDDVLHVNYCHSPPRWLYDLYHDRKGSLLGRLARPALRYFRLRDNSVDDRVDRYFANSPIVARRLWKYYNRDATVLPPPVDVEKYYDDGDEGFYLHLGRLDEEKGVPQIIDAFEGSERQLILAGPRGDVDDAVVERIESAANITYEGFVSTERKQELLATCTAVVFNGRNEDFGIIPVEANASGKACLVPEEGFPAILVDEGENGYHHSRSPDSIRAVLERFESRGLSVDPQTRAEKYSTATFERRLTATLEEWYDNFEARIRAPPADGSTEP